MTTTAVEFIEDIFAMFRRPNQDADATGRMMRIYLENLGDYDQSTLVTAKNHILQTRKDPFVPTLAEMLEVCNHVKAGTLRDLIDPEGAKKRAAAERELRAIIGNRPLPLRPLQPRED